MKATKGKVIHLYQRDPEEALERLNRITGLRFSSWPQSLVPVSTAIDAQAEAATDRCLELEAGPADMLLG